MPKALSFTAISLRIVLKARTSHVGLAARRSKEPASAKIPGTSGDTASSVTAYMQQQRRLDSAQAQSMVLATWRRLVCRMATLGAPVCHEATEYLCDKKRSTGPAPPSTSPL